ncbi:Glycine zipper 2TM domain-containing protein [Sphingomonas guangdongensis]|uniref:17 kDa surface antigen n=1 Tax=Sphingomonas guangdongensis TaxID=1141890 RepID=A0A285QLQ4_9SPHN|nr:glycine zipper 2TM domain-containing protein [Sphingomonas guangdongensis]SOB81022.1 Glycine zipper 2TM domain-containing protein [Sphingomonas guangdongensis]
MFKKLTLAGAAFAMGAVSLVPATPAMAQRYDRGYSYDRGDRYGYNDRRVYRGGDRRYYNNYRARQKCNDGDGGTIIGGVAGGLLGNQIAGRGDRTLGAILGAAAGALAGRAIDRSDRPNYCR